MADKGLYVHKKTGKKLLLVNCFPYQGDDTNWERVIMWHALTNGRWKYIKDSTVEKNYTISPLEFFKVQPIDKMETID